MTKVMTDGKRVNQITQDLGLLTYNYTIKWERSGSVVERVLDSRRRSPVFEPHRRLMPCGP